MYIKDLDIPLYLREIKILDGRPAYIFIPYENGFPTVNKVYTAKGIVELCPYCGNELNNHSCNCHSFRCIKEFNRTLNKSKKNSG